MNFGSVTSRVNIRLALDLYKRTWYNASMKTRIIITSVITVAAIGLTATAFAVQPKQEVQPVAKSTPQVTTQEKVEEKPVVVEATQPTPAPVETPVAETTPEPVVEQITMQDVRDYAATKTDNELHIRAIISAFGSNQEKVTQMGIGTFVELSLEYIKDKPDSLVSTQILSRYIYNY